jgi:hypothetical protein
VPSLTIALPRINLARGATALLLVALSLSLGGSQPPIAPAAPAADCVPRDEWDTRCAWFDALLDLAARADAELEHEAGWPAVRAAYGDDLELLAWIIAPRLVDEGIADEARVTTIAWHDFADEGSVVGRYHVDEDRIEMSSRYTDDPAWLEHSYLATLTHEIVHAHGYHDEMVTEALTIEALADLGNLGEPGFRRAALDLLRRKALLAAFYIAAHGGTMNGSVFGTPPCRPWVDGDCDEPPPVEAMVARWRAARRQAFTPAELRHADARLRWWERRGPARLLRSYVSRPLAMALEAACRPGQLQSRVPRPGVPDEGTQRAIVFDDTAYLLAELGWRCLHGRTPNAGP